jgi:hypothetical protein
MYPKSAPKSILEWTHLLSISTTFKFSRLRQLAIQELSTNHTLHPVEKIALSQTYDISDWFQPAFDELVQRERGPQLWESEKLGLTITVSIYTAREDMRLGLREVDKPEMTELTQSEASFQAGLLPQPSSPQVTSSNEQPVEVACPEQQAVQQLNEQSSTECVQSSLTAGNGDTPSVNDKSSSESGHSGAFSLFQSARPGIKTCLKEPPMKPLATLLLARMFAMQKLRLLSEYLVVQATYRLRHLRVNLLFLLK